MRNYSKLLSLNYYKKIEFNQRYKTTKHLENEKNVQKVEHSFESQGKSWVVDILSKKIL